MNILLINTASMVSRVLSLCARDTDIILDEVEHVDAALAEHYDIVFLDETLYEVNIEEISRRFVKSTKVLLATKDTNDYGMDILLKKPFLPSQIIKILNDSTKTEEVIQETVIETVVVEETTSELQHITDARLPQDVSIRVLDQQEIDKIKVLLEMDELEGDEAVVTLSEDAYSSRKVEVITEQLRAEGLEIVEQDAMIDALTLEDEPLVDEVLPKVEVELSEEDKVIQQLILEAIDGLKPKKRKRLFKGKEIEITLQRKDKK